MCKNSISGCKYKFAPNAEHLTCISCWNEAYAPLCDVCKARILAEDTIIKVKSNVGSAKSERAMHEACRDQQKRLSTTKTSLKSIAAGSKRVKGKTAASGNNDVGRGLGGGEGSSGALCGMKALIGDYGALENL